MVDTCPARARKEGPTTFLAQLRTRTTTEGRRATTRL